MSPRGGTLNYRLLVANGNNCGFSDIGPHPANVRFREKQTSGGCLGKLSTPGGGNPLRRREITPYRLKQKGPVMSSMEEIEMQKRRKALDKDVMSLVDKYIRAMEWNIPEANETKARQMILDEIKQAISRIEDRS
jgi:hypothetical protein